MFRLKLPNLSLRTGATLIWLAVLIGGPLAAVRAEGNTENPCLVPGTPGCVHGLPALQYELLLTQMAAYPAPNVRDIEVNLRQVRKYSFYRVARDGIVLYDAPGGNPVGGIEAGFNFVGIRQVQGDWAEIQPGKWTQLANLTPVSASTYTGIVLNDTPAFPIAWVLQPTRPSAMPGEKASPETPYLPRYTRLNIYATVSDGTWDWYLVGPGQWIEQRRVGKMVRMARPEGVKGRWIAVDLYEQVLVAYEDNKPIFTTLVATGLPKWSTNEGLFRIWSRFTSDAMSGAMGQPDFYSLPAVPYVMYFDQSISLHGTYWHDGFGYRHSHGCVNLSISDARWIYEWTDNFFADTWVYVWSSGSYAK